MENELENLRPEVRRAIEVLDVRADDDWTEYFIVRAALLRLAGDLNAARLSSETFEAKYQCMRERAERAEAELAALKARIAGSARAYHSSFEYTLDATTLYARATGIPGEETYALVKVED